VHWGGWWTIGIDVGWGAALGVLFAGLFGARRGSVAANAGLAAAAAVAAGFLIWNWPEAAGGLVGALCGTFAAQQIVGGALRRGGTRGGTAVLVAVAALVVAALAIAPVVGYLEAALLPVLAVRMRRRAPERYAGLRTLARD
jgi:hypothetical protein